METVTTKDLILAQFVANEYSWYDRVDIFSSFHELSKLGYLHYYYFESRRHTTIDFPFCKQVIEKSKNK